MTQNHFKPFATGTNAIVQTQEDYEKSVALKEGFRKGLARSNEVNKAIRQATSIAAAVAGFTAEKSEQDILDNGDIDTLQQQFETAIRTISTTLTAEAEGEADALTATFTPTLKHLSSGKTVLVRAKGKNISKTPTIQADQTGAKEIVKGNNLPLEEGDIAGAGHWLELQFDEALDKWVLQNPAKGISPLNGVPVGTVEYFAMSTPPAGYLKADGRAVGRETYAELFTAIGTTFGEGDGEMTFNLPDLRGEFIRGWDDERFVDANREFGSSQNFAIENILGSLGSEDKNAGYQVFGESVQSIMDESGALSGKYFPRASVADVPNMTVPTLTRIEFDASKSVQTADETRPRNIALLPCIKAFDAATNPGLIDITGLANEVDGKLDRIIDSKPVRYVIDAYNDDTNWYRKWSDGWVEQGGQVTNISGGVKISLLIVMADNAYSLSATSRETGDNANIICYAPTSTNTVLHLNAIMPNMGWSPATIKWEVKGQGA